LKRKSIPVGVAVAAISSKMARTAMATNNITAKNAINQAYLIRRIVTQKLKKNIFWLPIKKGQACEAFLGSMGSLEALSQAGYKKSQCTTKPEGNTSTCTER